MGLLLVLDMEEKIVEVFHVLNNLCATLFGILPAVDLLEFVQKLAKQYVSSRCFYCRKFICFLECFEVETIIDLSQPS